MISRSPDIVIFGAGIAGLWIFHRLKKLGYDVLLLESASIGGVQSIASQGIIHSGIKFALAGKINKLAQTMSAMPLRWRDALMGDGEVSLSQAHVHSTDQFLLIPKGLVGGVTKLMTQKILGPSASEISFNLWPDGLKNAGFSGSLIRLNEMVLDIPSVIKALANPYFSSIRHIPHELAQDPLSFLKKHSITPKMIIFASAGSNYDLAKFYKQDQGLETQTRPLLMGLVKPAPFSIYAHCIGASDKPAVTITSHTDNNGELIWYLGASVAERSKDCPPDQVFLASKDVFSRYLPSFNYNNLQWASLPVDRFEGKSSCDNLWLPDTPTVHKSNNVLYCWPTKLTFSPLLSDMVLQEIYKSKITPSSTHTDWSFLMPCPYAIPPWDKVVWTK